MTVFMLCFSLLIMGLGMWLIKVADGEADGTSLAILLLIAGLILFTISINNLISNHVKDTLMIKLMADEKVEVKLNSRRSDIEYVLKDSSLTNTFQYVKQR